MTEVCVRDAKDGGYVLILPTSDVGAIESMSSLGPRSNIKHRKSVGGCLTLESDSAHQ
jgi:hypothetical protein